MGVYIKGMEMPKTCKECWFTEGCIDDLCCLFTTKPVWLAKDGRDRDCPLTEVPEPLREQAPKEPKFRYKTYKAGEPLKGSFKKVYIGRKEESPSS